jgi:hypothetical protein
MKFLRLCLSISFLIPATIVFAQPKIQIVDGKKFDFGDVYKGSKAIQTMMIKNIGTDTLNIDNVSAQCGCTATLLSQKKIAPSQTGKLSITFNTGSYDGKVTKHVYVSSNDPSSAKDTIEFYANVISSLTLTPNALSFNLSKVDSTYEKTITITNSSKQAIKILSAKPSFDQLKIALMKNQLMPGEQTEMQAVLHPGSAKPGFQGTIALKTDHPNQPQIDISVFEWFNQK